MLDIIHYAQSKCVSKPKAVGMSRSRLEKGSFSSYLKQAENDTMGMLNGSSSQTSHSTVNEGFQRLFRCYYCESKFRTYKHLKIHHAQQHGMRNGVKTNTKIRYSFVVVSGRYIKLKRESCKTKPIEYNGAYMVDHKGELIKSPCNLRNCTICESHRKHRYKKKFTKSILDFQRVVLFTLTYQGHHLLSKRKKKELEVHVRNFVKRLGRRIIYKLQYVRVLEIKKSSNNSYYYHFHFLIDMPYVKQGTLSRMWEQTTETSYIVDIRCVKDDHGKPVGIFWKRLTREEKEKLINGSLNYIVKYLAKPIGEISDHQYASVVYNSHFIETRITNVSSLEVSGQNSSIKKTTNYKFWVGTEDPRYKLIVGATP